MSAQREQTLGRPERDGPPTMKRSANNCLFAPYHRATLPSKLKLLTKLRHLIRPRPSPATAPHLLLGERGEKLAAQRLLREGYDLVAFNFKINVGRNSRGAIIQAELDLIAYEGETLCFIEIKTRASDWFAPPEANVDLRKRRQVARAARAYRKLLGIYDQPYRYDVVTVILPAESEETNPRVEVLRNFWKDERFRKRKWSDFPIDF